VYLVSIWCIIVSIFVIHTLGCECGLRVDLLRGGVVDVEI
jgi:hypothetical protein